MQIYTACDSRHRFFIDAIERSVRRVRRSNPSMSITYIFNPKRQGGDTGKVVQNVLRIMDSDLILFDITPSKTGSGQSYNAGTMIEYGLVLACQNPRLGNPWGGKQPKPSCLVFCAAPRKKLTPILNELSIIPYGKGREGRKKLSRFLVDEIETHLAMQPQVTGVPSISGPVFLAGDVSNQPVGTIYATVGTDLTVTEPSREDSDQETQEIRTKDQPPS